MYPTVPQAVWKVMYRVTVRWSKRQNLAIVVGVKVTSCVLFPPSAFSRFLVTSLRSHSRVIALILATAAPAALEHPVVGLVPARNAIAAARSATLRARAPRHPEAEAAQEEDTEVVEEEGTVALEEEEEEAVKKPGAFSSASCLARGGGY